MGSEGEYGCKQGARTSARRGSRRYRRAPDRESFFGEQSVPLGILEGLPRTPHVFEEQTFLKLDNAPWDLR